MVLLPTAAHSQDTDLAKQLSNPIASLISVPFQFNFDDNIGLDDGGYRIVMNVQPVIPIALSDDLNLISRTILPITYQEDVVSAVTIPASMQGGQFIPAQTFGPSGAQFGLGDTVQSLFLSPANPGPSGIIYGAGPVFLLPTATETLLGGDKWGAGPTAVALKQTGPWTYGVLANHIWSFAGADDRRDVSATFLQPFLSYTTSDAWTFALNTESTYDWVSEEWSVPVNFQISKLVTIGEQPISLQAGVRYWADSPPGGPEGFGARLGVTFLFPKG
nr:transporter [Jiella endophytica]